MSYSEYAEAHKDEINEDFRRYDVNEDTFVDLEEYKDTFRSLGTPLHEKLFAMDVNKDKYVTYDEYCGEQGMHMCKTYNERCKGKSDSRCTGFKADVCRWIETDSEN